MIGYSVAQWMWDTCPLFLFGNRALFVSLGALSFAGVPGVPDCTDGRRWQSVIGYGPSPMDVGHVSLRFIWKQGVFLALGAFYLVEVSTSAKSASCTRWYRWQSLVGYRKRPVDV